MERKEDPINKEFISRKYMGLWKGRISDHPELEFGGVGNTPPPPPISGWRAEKYWGVLAAAVHGGKREREREVFSENRDKVGKFQGWLGKD